MMGRTIIRAAFMIFICTFITILGFTKNSVASDYTGIADFVTRFYQLCLNRDPDPAGLNGWVEALLNGSQTGSDVAYGFVFSQEFLAKNTSESDYLAVLYLAFFNRQPDAAGLQGWMDAFQSGASREDVLEGFIYAIEFANLCDEYGIKAFEGHYPRSQREPVEAFVTRFYQLCLDRDPDAAGLNGWTRNLLDKVQTGADVANGFIFSQEFVNKNTSNDQYLTILYKAFFNRDPDQAGWNVWLDDLNSGRDRGEVLNGFIYSQEFCELCKRFGIKAFGGAGCGGDDDDLTMDSDGDGIPNILEINGYTYDYVTGIYSLWNGDVSKVYFKSDPNQVSSDGDPYSDSMEVSGLNMDRSVRSPGNHPMVPAYPKFVVKLINYDVTLNSTITETNGTEHQKNTTWNADTYDITATTDEIRWDVSEEANCSLTDFGASVSVSYGESQAVTRTTGTVRSNGGGIMDSSQWSLATCSNPSEAAKIKLTLLAENVGTCTANNIQLTMNLKIGGQIVATEEMAIEIYSLDPDNSFRWVESDIILTYRELRALETGAPVSLEVTQVTADVVKELDGKMVSVGKWENYMSTAKAVCANIFLDLGDGNTIDQLVYADDSETSPEVTLKDAIIWAANAHDDPAEGPVVRFYQTDGSLGPAKPLDGWYFYFSQDASTYGSISAEIQDPGFNLFDTVLGPNSIVVAKAPPIEAWPKIRWATLSTCEEKVKAYVDDYFFHQSLLEVTFVDKNGVDHPMTWDAENSYFYCDCPYDYIMYGNEKIIALTPMHDPDKPGEWKTVMEASNIGYDPCKFKDMGDGTIRDNETGLYWLKTADCTELVWVNSAGKATWQYAKLAVGSLTNNTCGLSDGSRPGDWRLPTVEEWDTLTNRKYYKPALTNTRGTGQWKQGDPFVITMHSFTQDDEFWTSSLCPASIPGYAIECPDCGEKPISWDIWFGGMNTYADQCDREMEFRVWPVRDGD